MIDPGSSKLRPAAPGSVSDGKRDQPLLLIVEPERLLRWSMATYLGRWFTTFPTESETGAVQVLNDFPIDAVVISDDLTGRAAEEIEACARARNPAVRVVWTVTSPRIGASGCPAIPSVEKPFELAHLASLLGVTDLTNHESRNRNGCSSPTI